jgi:HlyD family secretion protein
MEQILDEEILLILRRNKMKPILININEMSDSREVYESKPNIFLSLFIYLVLAILAIALIWMYFGKIDVVVKSEGMLRPNNQVATVINTYGGTLEAIYVEDGSSVKEGDTLFIVEHGDLLTELKYYEEQLNDTGENMNWLSTYKQSVEDSVNYFTNTADEEEYYLKYQSYMVNYKRMENDYYYSNTEREMNLTSVTDQLKLLNEKFKYTQTLKTAINKNRNLFTASREDQEYYTKFLKYKSDYEALNIKYASAKTEIDNSTTTEGFVNSLEYYNNVLKGLKTLKSSIVKDKSLFDSESSYSLQYEEYINKITDLTTAYEQAEENYEANKALEGLAVSEWDVQQSKAAMEEAERTIDTYKVNFMNSITTNITEVEKNILDITLSKDNTLSKDKLLEQNESDWIAALDNFKLQHIVELDNILNSLTDNIASLEANKQSLELQSEKTIVDTNGIEASLTEYRNKELSNVINSINTYENKKSELETNIDKINSQIDSAIVKATMSGSININIELVEGNTLQSGVEVLSIIPDNNIEYKANTYVSNEDIGKLKEGMKVKFNIYALPNSEYGYLTGTITSISKDLKVDNGSGSAYYLVKAELDNNKLYNSKGQEANLKAGMACQAQIITENKRILIYLLEKIDLWKDK